MGYGSMLYECDGDRCAWFCACGRDSEAITVVQVKMSKSLNKEIEVILDKSN